MRLLFATLWVASLLATGCAGTSSSNQPYSPPDPAAVKRKSAGSVTHAASGYYLYRRVSKNGEWDFGTPCSEAVVQALLNVASTAKRWDGLAHANSYTEKHAFAPDPVIGLARVGSGNERIIRTLDVCEGNWLLWYQGKMVHVSQEGHATLNRLFPENK